MGRNYYNKLVNLSLDSKEIRKIGFPLRQELVDRSHYIIGGTIQGCEFALQNGVGMNIAGGTHHAFKDHGEAFCLLNDQAIAAHYLLDTQKASKILIIDLDVHQGNGTAMLFKDNPNVFTFSMHGAKNYPFKKQRSDLGYWSRKRYPRRFIFGDFKKHIAQTSNKSKARFYILLKWCRYFGK